jgi:hypothetical protein
MTARTPITGACVWHGQDMASSPRWQRDLTPAALAEIDAALRAVQRRGLAWHAITRQDFPLEQAADQLAAVAEELE